MIKRTLYFGNPAYLSCKDEQLCIKMPGSEDLKTAPIEDIGIIILDNQQITITHRLIEKLLVHNAALITCDARHHPTGLLLNLDGNTLQSQRFQYQIAAKVPLKKQLWQKTVQAKITNQAAVLTLFGIDARRLHQMTKDVKSGDSSNVEAKASVYYWRNFLPENFHFFRDRMGLPPNNLLNYGYAILRACVARSLVGSGLLPTLGIFHRNQYNAYCLADDIMEPYRPFVDKIVRETVMENKDALFELTTDIKQKLLKIPAIDVCINGQVSPLMVGLQRTTASLAKSFENDLIQIAYPEI